MSHERLLLNSAFELHYGLVESYIELNSVLSMPDLSDEQRFLCYKNHLKNIQRIYEQVKETAEEDAAESTFCCFFKKKSSQPSPRYIATVYDQQNLQLQEEQRKKLDPYISAFPVPIFLPNKTPMLIHFGTNGSIPITHNLEDTRFKFLFMQLLKKAKDAMTEKTYLEKIKKEEDPGKKVVLETEMKKRFLHPFYQHKHHTLPSSSMNTEESSYTPDFHAI